MQKCWCGKAVSQKYSEHYYVCNECHTLVSDVDFSKDVEHVENEDEDLYGKNYWEKLMCRLTGKSSLEEVIDYYLQERTLYWIQSLLKYSGGGIRVAEIGAGIGQFCYLMKRAGFKPTGFELSKEICNYAEETLNVDMYQGDIGEVSETFDMIVAFDLLEHIVDPDNFIKRCGKHLKADGIICLQTPCYNPDLSYEDMLEKAPRFQTHLTEFQHINLFSKKAAEKLLRRQGFNYINFEPAVFGDDYDMFVFASREPMKQYGEKEINEYLNSVESGRLIKSMCSLYQQVNEKQKVIEELAAYKNYLEKEIETLKAAGKRKDLLKRKFFH